MRGMRQWSLLLWPDQPQKVYRGCDCGCGDDAGSSQFNVLLEGDINHQLSNVVHGIEAVIDAKISMVKEGFCSPT
jgi:hypothetical protein